jgi:STE24 endopeptidase
MLRILLTVALLTLAATPALAQDTQTQSYHLPPGKYERAVEYSHVQYAIHFLGILWTAGALLGMLNYRLAPRLRTWVEEWTRRRFVQAALFVPGLLFALDISRLPLDVFAHHVELHFDQSVQGWWSWLWDWTKGELLELLLAALLGWMLYALIRRSLRRWWFHFWLASLPVVVFLIYVQPIVIEPLFFEFEPLVFRQPNLVDSIERVVERGGLSIPPERIYLMKASKKLNSLNAYVDGIGSSKRVVVWDTTIAKMTPPQILYVFGHEMGHYVLGHIPKMIVFTMALLLGAMAGAYRGVGWALERWGSRWEIRGVKDWASLPLLLLIFVACGFLAEPVINTASRYIEHQADIYGIKVTFGFIPPAAQTGPEVFQILGETDLAEPDPNPLIEFWMFSHPSIAKRVAFAQQYDPWSRHEMRYIH